MHALNSEKPNKICPFTPDTIITHKAADVILEERLAFKHGRGGWSIVVQGRSVAVECFTVIAEGQHRDVAGNHEAREG